jgi:exodeoxyribonuclease VII large subunit
LRDILNILRRRHYSANVLIYPAQVQGEGAGLEVGNGIRYFNKTGIVDVIIVARGGGSAEDLAAFNNEGLARIVANSTIPIISAIGHETDFTIIDFVSDLRAATPSAAAEMVIRSRQEIEEQSESLRKRLGRAMRYRLLMGRQAITELATHGAFGRMMDAINRRQQRLDEFTFRLTQAEQRVLERWRRRFEILSAAVRHYDARRVLSNIRKDLEAQLVDLAAATRNSLLERKVRLGRLATALEALSPLAILERGYALVFDAQGKLLKDAGKARAGEEISARLAKGQVWAVVKRTEER